MSEERDVSDEMDTDATPSDEPHAEGTPAPDTETTHEDAPGEEAARDSSSPFEGGSWDEVTSALEDFGHAVSAWAGALKDDPETRRHARQLKDGFERLGSELGVTLDSAAKSDLGRSVTEAAGRAGAAVSDVARKTGDQVAPVIVTALRGAAEGIQRAADAVERRTAAGAGEPGAEEPAGASESIPQPPPAPEQPTPEPPPAPAPPIPPEPPSESD